MAEEKMAEVTDTTTKAAGHGVKTFVINHGSAWSAEDRCGFRLKANMPIMPTVIENNPQMR